MQAINNNSNNTNTTTTTTTKNKIISRHTTPVEFALATIGSPVTKENYIRKLKLFFDYVALPGNTLEEQGQAFLEKAKTENNNSNNNNNNNPYWAEDIILNFIESQKQQIAPSTIRVLFWAVKAFCEAHERDLQLTINWKRLSKTLPETQSYSSNDRMPTVEEIRKLVGYPDRRIKPLLYVMCSTGIRLGAWQYLQWKHVKPITNNEKKGDEKIIAAKLMVYPGCKEQYYTFMTPEAFQALQEWMDYRALQGEKITGESWLMRDMWRTIDVKGRSWKKGEGIGLATHPKKLGYAGMKKILNRALWAQGLRNALPEGVNRHEVKEAHGYRKFYKTRAEDGGMKTLNVEFLMGHNNGLQRSYYKPTEKEVLKDYLKAIPALTINNDQSVLQKQVAELAEKNEETNYVIEGKLAEKEKEIEALARKAEEADIMKKEIVELRTYVNEKQKEAYEREVSYEKRMKLLEEMDDKQQDAIYKEDMKMMREGLEQLRWEMKREMNRNVKKELREVITAREKRLTEYDLEEKKQQQKEKKMKKEKKKTL